MNRNHLPDWRYFCYLVGAFAIFYSVGILVSGHADAAEFPVGNRWVQPYGGCKEAWQAPRSDGAAECRAHGWTVRPGLVVGPHGRVRYSTLPRCRNEDGSGQRHACSWNFTPGDGNSRGLVFWLDRKDRTHYVWPNRIDWSGGWEWVDSGLSDALAEGEEYGAPERDWQRCLVRFGRGTHSLVVCPDGLRVAS